MKFRFVWVGSDDDGSGRPCLREDADYTPRSGYEQRDGAMFRRERLQNRRLRFTQLANFMARIVADIVLDDGEQERREFGIEAELGRCKVAFPLSAAEFGRMNWVLRRLGPQAIVYPGQQQHARAAIQFFSRPTIKEPTLRLCLHLRDSAAGGSAQILGEAQPKHPGHRPQVKFEAHNPRRGRIFRGPYRRSEMRVVQKLKPASDLLYAKLYSSAGRIKRPMKLPLDDHLGSFSTQKGVTSDEEDSICSKSVKTFIR
jgi:hypothetical protein